MRIGIVGSGGVGGFFGARLARGGNDVLFIARGAHAAAIEAHGLRVLSDAGDLHIHPASVTDRPADHAPVDVLVFATKLYDLAGAVELSRPLLGAQTVAIPLLNGIDAAPMLAAALGASRVAGGVAIISARVERPGVIRHVGAYQQMLIGPLPQTVGDATRALAEAASAAGIQITHSDDIETVIWQKFVVLSALSAATALARAPLGVLRVDPRSWTLLDMALDESLAVARAAGANLDQAAGEALRAQVAGFPDEVKASMALDLERGKRLELEWLSGAVVRLAEQFGLAVPLHRVVLGALLPYANGTAPGSGQP